MWSDAWFVVAIAGISIGAGWSGMHCIRHRQGRAPSWLPEELRNDTLAYVERTFRTVEHPMLVARVDRAYRSSDGLITLVELKTRGEARVYPSDIIELSAQRMALSADTGEPVSTVAHVVVESEGRRKPLPVRLLRTVEVEGLIQRREHLLAGRLMPHAPPHEGPCAGCRWRARCRPEPPGVAGPPGKRSGKR